MKSGSQSAPWTLLVWSAPSCSLFQAGSDFSDSNLGSPCRRLSTDLSALGLPEEEHPPLLQPGTDAERDFFSHLYAGDMGGDGSEGVPEDYYNYLESWYGLFFFQRAMGAAPFVGHLSYQTG